jgi:hypothetical protein
VVKPLPLPEQWNSLIESDPARLDVVIPVEVLAPVRINVLAVWSYNNRNRKSGLKLRGPVLCALDFLGDWLSKAPFLVIGDFNFGNRGQYHIDYIFASQQLREASQFSIMSLEEMKASGVKSDHVPLWADFSDASPEAASQSAVG